MAVSSDKLSGARTRVILGIDPGYAILGFGAIAAAGNTLKLLEYGAIESGKETPFPDRLEQLYMGTKRLIERTKPDCIVFEELFFAKNVKTALYVSAARGVTILAAQQSCLPLYEYTPMQIKTNVCGDGRADKRQMQEMVKLLMHMDILPKPDDAADGIAAAICHAGMATVMAEEYRIK